MDAILRHDEFIDDIDIIYDSAIMLLLRAQMRYDMMFARRCPAPATPAGALLVSFYAAYVTATEIVLRNMMMLCRYDAPLRWRRHARRCFIYLRALRHAIFYAHAADDFHRSELICLIL